VIPYMRRKEILSYLKNNEITYINELTEIFSGVSESTIRRDLKNLEEEGKVNLLTGGAAKINTSIYETPVKTKQKLNIEEKKKIAKKAASLINDGETIYIDSGTTTLQMIQYIKNKKIKLYTTNTLVLNELNDSQFACILIGGEITSSLGSIVGPTTDRELSNLFFDKAFIGANGCTIKGGINTPDIKEGRKKEIVQKNSKESYVLLDNSKMGNQTTHKVFNLDECTIITDMEDEILKENAKYIIA